MRCFLSALLEFRSSSKFVCTKQSHPHDGALLALEVPGEDPGEDTLLAGSSPPAGDASAICFGSGQSFASAIA